MRSALYWRALLLPFLICLGCATQYRFTPVTSTHFSGKIALPEGAADRLIVRVDNREDTWLHVRWSDAKIVGLTGFAVPARIQPADPLSSVPPRSSVEYHLFPGHDYWPEGYYQYRRDGFSTLLVYDTDYDRIANTGREGRTATLELYVPTCRGSATACCTTCDKAQAWSMTYIRGSIKRKGR